MFDDSFATVCFLMVFICKEQHSKGYSNSMMNKYAGAGGLGGYICCSIQPR